MTRLVVDLAALRRNYRAICKETGVTVIPMLKADCYGLGAQKVFEVLKQEGAQRFAVSRMEEGLPLCNREAEILLGSRYFSQKQIAERCGFSDVKYFRNAFKAATGKTPRQYGKETKAP